MTPNSPEPIVRAMLHALHRRDHDHESLAATCCHPHSVEVVHLGSASIAVCHDCRYESGFTTVRDCERAAADHRLLTA
jgi:hypothetical protein